MNDIDIMVKNRLEIRSEIISFLTDDLIGVVTKKMRGITLNYNDRLLEINVFFDAELTEEEEDEMMDIDTSLISSGDPGIYNGEGEVILNIDFYATDFIVIPSDIDISDKEGNLGWVFLRKEYS